MEHSTAVKRMCCGDKLPAERDILIVSGWEGVNNESMYERCGWREVWGGGMSEEEYIEVVWPC